MSWYAYDYEYDKRLEDQISKEDKMAGCGVKIPVTIPTKYSAKIIEMPCGSTGIYGYPNLCDKCEELYKNRDWRKEAIEAGECWDENDY